MKKIAYIEIDTHAEIAGNFLELMQDSHYFKIDYYFSEKIFNLIGKNQSNIFCTESYNLLKQLEFNNYDLIILGTVHRYFNLFDVIVNKYNTAIIVHNINFSKISQFQIFKNLFKKDFKYRLKLWLKEDLFSAPEVYKKAKNLLILDESLVSGRLQYLPVFFNQFQNKNNSEFFTIVIPGEVSQKRRDYQKVLEELRNFNSSTFKKVRNFQIIFLGKARLKELFWLHDFKQENYRNVSIQYFEEKVPQNIFDDWMKKADVLWCPIQNETEFFSNKEFYGKTKMSGNIGDAIKYGKVAIFPENYKSESEFIIPEQKDLLAQFQNISDIHFDYQGEYSKTKVQQNLENVLHNLKKNIEI